MTTLAPLARCVIRGCPVRFRRGGDRLCRWHGADDTSVNLTTRASGFSVTMAAFDGGDRDGGDRDGGDGGSGGDGDGDGGQAADGRRAAGQAVNRHGVALR